MESHWCVETFEPLHQHHVWWNLKAVRVKFVWKDIKENRLILILIDQNVALVALATIPSSHKDLLSAVKSWPPVIYSVVPVIAAIEPQLNTSSMTDELKEALAALYEIDGQYEKAFALYADLMKPEIFEFIEKHNLHDALREKVVQLMLIDHKRSVSLLIQHRDVITPTEVVSQLLASRKQCNSRYFLYEYLHSLFEVNPHAGRDFHDIQRLHPATLFLQEPMQEPGYILQHCYKSFSVLDARVNAGCGAAVQMQHPRLLPPLPMQLATTATTTTNTIDAVDATFSWCKCFSTTVKDCVSVLLCMAGLSLIGDVMMPYNLYALY